MAYPTEAQHQKNDAAAMKIEGAAAARWVQQIQANVDAFFAKAISYEAFSAKQSDLWKRIDAGGATLVLAVMFLLRTPDAKAKRCTCGEHFDAASGGV